VREMDEWITRIDDSIDEAETFFFFMNDWLGNRSRGQH